MMSTTTQAADDPDPAEVYRRDYLRVMRRLDAGLRRAGKFGGRKGVQTR